jgi:hypothetical protein
VADIAHQLGWAEASSAWPEGAEDEPRRATWEIAPGTTLEFLHEPVWDISCVAVISDEGQQQADRFASGGRFAVLSAADLLRGARAEGDVTSRRVAIVKVGLGSARARNDEFAAALESAARDSKWEIREAAVLGICYTEWPSFLPLLREMSARDAKRRVRKFAERAVAAFRSSGTGE